MENLTFQPYMITVVVILFLNVFATMAILKNQDNKKYALAKPFQLAGVWLIPVFAAIGILTYYYGKDPSQKNDLR